MAFTNSPLVSYTNLSPNHSGQRDHKIDTITIHCAVGQVSVEGLGSWFGKESTQASSNYGVAYDGKIGLYVEEKNRSWCTSSRGNDDRAVTIEVACDPFYPYEITAKAYASLISLLCDICKRNDIKKLLWRGDKTLAGQVEKQNMTVHRWFVPTECPGEYLYNKHGEIAAEVNKHLGEGETFTKFAPNDVVSIVPGAVYYTGKEVPAWVAAKKWIVRRVDGDRVVIDKSTDGNNSIMSPIHAQYLTMDSPGKLKTFEEVAMEVIRGDYGNGAVRFENLRFDGYDPDIIQDIVNKILEG